MIFEACYRSLGLPARYRRNPLNEALPPLMEEADLLASLVNLPALDSECRSLPYSERIYDVDVFDGLYVPPPIVGNLACTIDRIIRDGYRRRNPISPKVVGQMYTSQELIAAQMGNEDPLLGGVLLRGGSGSGKSRLIALCLRRFPQAIRHTTYEGKPFIQIQVVWISVLAPVNGSMKGFLLLMLHELDKAAENIGTGFSYYESSKKLSVEVLITVVANAAKAHKLGILHLDDLQRLGESARGRTAAIQELMQLVTRVGCPVISSGTPTGLHPLISSKSLTDLELVRRLAHSGDFGIVRPKSHDDPFFRTLVNACIKYQWTDEALAKSDDVYQTLYKLSMGVTGVLVLLHKLAQIHALSIKSKTFELRHYGEAYRRNMVSYIPALRSLRKNTKGADAEYEAALEARAKKDANALASRNVATDLFSSFSA